MKRHYWNTRTDLNLNHFLVAEGCKYRIKIGITNPISYAIENMENSKLIAVFHDLPRTKKEVRKLVNKEFKNAIC